MDLYHVINNDVYTLYLEPIYKIMNQAEDIVVYILFHVSHLVFIIGML